MKNKDKKFIAVILFCQTGVLMALISLSFNFYHRKTIEHKQMSENIKNLKLLSQELEKKSAKQEYEVLKTFYKLRDERIENTKIQEEKEPLQNKLKKQRDIKKTKEQEN